MPENIFEDTKIMFLGQLSGNLWQKAEKMTIFGCFFQIFFRGGAKFLKSERPIFNRRQVECFGPKKYYLCRKLYPHQLPDTNIIYTTEYKNHLQNRESAVG